MRPRLVLAPEDVCEIFDAAVQEQALAVLSIHEGDGWRTFKSRFLERDPNRRFFVLDHQPAPDDDVPELLPGQYLGLSLRQKNRKILFATMVEAKGHFLLEGNTSIRAIRYRWPETITELQRRAYYRTPVPDGHNLLANLWFGGTNARQAAQGKPLQLVNGYLSDISCGGALVRVNQVGPPGWKEGSTLGCEIHLGDGKPPVVLDAYYRGVRQGSDQYTGIAIQFVGLEVDVDGKLALKRLANCVQRFHRSSIARGKRDWHQN